MQDFSSMFSIFTAGIFPQKILVHAKIRWDFAVGDPAQLGRRSCLIQPGTYLLFMRSDLQMILWWGQFMIWHSSEQYFKRQTYFKYVEGGFCGLPHEVSYGRWSKNIPELVCRSHKPGWLYFGMATSCYQPFLQCLRIGRGLGNQAGPTAREGPWWGLQRS